MAKKKKGKTQNKSVNKPKAVVADEVKVSAPEAEVKAEAVAEVNQPEVKPEVKETKCEKAGKKSKVAKDVKKESKPKKPNKLAKNLKDTGAELKKVTWPKFKDVVKQTGIVLVVVLVFALVLFGLDRLCYWLTSFLY